MIVTVTCPACWQSTSLEIDAWEGRVDVIEDCQVCCHPLRVYGRLTAQTELDDEEEVLVEPDADGLEVELAA